MYVDILYECGVVTIKKSKSGLCILDLTAGLIITTRKDDFHINSNEYNIDLTDLCVVVRL